MEPNVFVQRQKGRALKLLTVVMLVCQAGLFAQQVTVARSQIRKISSAVVKGQEYQLHIMLPSGYETSDKKYPVVYLMDAQWDFPLTTALYGEQYYDGFIPELILVGVTWGGEHPNPDSLRARDYTPTATTSTPQGGGAAAFLSFIETELFPFVESNFRTKPNDRTLAGCSLGGLFTLYSLFTKPGLFQRYIAASPAFGWDNEVLYKYESQYAAKAANAPARLYLIMGGVERGVPGFNNLVAVLAGRKYSNLEMESRILDNTGHSGTKAEGYARGLQYVFKRPSVTYDAATLDKYAGSYKAADGNVVRLEREKDQLRLVVNAGDKFSLLAAGDTEFYSTAEFLKIHFTKGTNGAINGFQLDRYGGSMAFVRQ